MKLTDDIRALKSNHLVLLDRRAAAEQEIASSERKIKALEAALTPDEKLELDPPAPVNVDV